MTKDLGNGIGELGHHDEDSADIEKERHGSVPDERSDGPPQPAPDHRPGDADDAGDETDGG